MENRNLNRQIIAALFPSEQDAQQLSAHQRMDLVIDIYNLLNKDDEDTIINSNNRVLAYVNEAALDHNNNQTKSSLENIEQAINNAENVLFLLNHLRNKLVVLSDSN